MRSVFSRSNSDLYIVMRRGSLRRFACVAGSAVVLALGVGFAVGNRDTHNTQKVVFVHDEIAAPPIRAPFSAVEFARLQADNASLEARVGQLVARVDTFSELDRRLRAQPPGTAVSKTAAITPGSNDDAAGGPALPPRNCQADNALVTPAELDCLSATIAALEQEVNRHDAAWQAVPGRRPVAPGRMSSSFGNRLDPFTHHLSFHSGVDLAAPTGTPVHAAAAGRVVYAGPMPGYGNAIDIDHGNGLISRYAHVLKIDVRAGQKVGPGEPIAKVGSTGRSTGPHLHFEVRDGDRPVDPADYLALFAGASHA
jgi:murein DD-endopeptidase MepM/ murein hydrolase activator NlpD